MKTYQKILELARQANELRTELCKQHEWIADLDLQGAIAKLEQAAKTRQAEVDKLNAEIDAFCANAPKHIYA